MSCRDASRLSTGKKICFLAASLLAVLVLGELAAHAIFRLQHGRVLWKSARGDGLQLFEPHPYLVGTLKPGAKGKTVSGSVEVSPEGYRGPPLRPGARRILCLGGSTTFCVGVGDAETWPWKLQGELAGLPGASIDVVNAGVPGYSSAENLIQFELRDHYLEPGLVILYQGLNDLRSSHAPTFSTDYARSHGDLQARSLDLDWKEGHSICALRYYWRQSLKKLWPPEEAKLPQHAEPDPRVARVYGSNLRSLAALARCYGTRLVFVPQMIWPAAKNPTPGRDAIARWLPYIAKESILQQMAVLNDIMHDVATKEGIPFVQEVLDATWCEADFRDYCHYSPQGCTRFAKILSSFLQARGLIPGGRPEGM